MTATDKATTTNPSLVALESKGLLQMRVLPVASLSLAPSLTAIDGFSGSFAESAEVCCFQGENLTMVGSGLVWCFLQTGTMKKE